VRRGCFALLWSQFSVRERKGSDRQRKETRQGEQERGGKKQGRREDLHADREGDQRWRGSGGSSVERAVGESNAHSYVFKWEEDRGAARSGSSPRHSSAPLLPPVASCRRALAAFPLCPTAENRERAHRQHHTPWASLFRADTARGHPYGAPPSIAGRTATRRHQCPAHRGPTPSQPRPLLLLHRYQLLLSLASPFACSVNATGRRQSSVTMISPRHDELI
jgi:hypothetical protein